jgi:DNA-binding transcriptional ArsR family regulator
MQAKQPAADARGNTRIGGSGGRVKVAQYDAARLRRVMEAAERQAHIATVLASPLRCATLSLLATCPVMSVGDIATLTETTLALTSYHLRQLEAEGLVTIEKSGREHHVRLDLDTYLDMIRTLHSLAVPD